MLTQQDKEKIKKYLSGKFAPGKYHMPVIAYYLKEMGCDYTAFGYKKFKAFLLDAPELFELCQDDRQDGGDWVAIKEWSPAPPAPKPPAPNTPAPKPPAPEVPKPPAPEDNDLPQGRLDTFCVLPDRPVSILREAAGESAPEAVRQALTEDYAGALSGGQVLRSAPRGEEVLTFPCRYRKRDGTPIMLTLARSERDPRYPWYLQYVDASAPAARNEDGIPREALDAFCSLPDRPVQILCDAVKADPQRARKEMAEDYAAAVRDGRVRLGRMGEEQLLIFPTRYQKSDGSSVTLSLAPSGRNPKYSWYLKYVDATVEPKQYLENFAYVGWPGFLSRLAERALPEAWDFEGSTSKGYDILKKYITYTFYRLSLEKKVLVSDDGAFAAFNTGLVDPHYNDICACFEPNKAVESGVPWAFKEFATAGYGEYGKRLTRYFNPLPQPAEYFRRKEDLLFDLNRPLLSDFDHIIIDNIHRLPLEFLSNQLYDYPEAARLLSDIRDHPENRGADYDRLRDCLEGESKWSNRLINRLKDAIELARKQVRWNYKTAIPSYFPTGNSMSLMLPLSLEDDRVVDTVLVVELTPSGNYQGQTILTMQQAYIDARLLCRPNSEWLTTANLDGGMDLDDEPAL